VEVAVYLPLALAALLGLSARALGRRLPPATATRLLTGAAVLSAAASSFVLGVLGFTLVAQLAPVAAAGHWSVEALQAVDPVPRLAAAIAIGAVCVLGFAGVRAALGRARALLAALALSHHLGAEDGRALLVVDEETVDVFAVPTARGRIIASRRLLEALSPAERRALLAHENAHLDHHHYAYRVAADLAAAVNPVLRPVARAVRYATERWSDEVAATTVGDRRVVAAALAHASLHRCSARRPVAGDVAAMHAVQGAVVERVDALLAPPPRHQPLIVLGVLGLVAATVFASVDAQADTDLMFDHLATAQPAATAGPSATGHQETP
jgi:Zn-dependent protease with chaperone function